MRAGEQHVCEAGFRGTSMLPIRLGARRALGGMRMPEQQLLLAVLENAVASFQRHALSRERGARREFAEAHDWLFSDDSSWPLAFVNVCQALDLEPRYLREGLAAWLDDAHTAAAKSEAAARHDRARAVSGTS
jgi:hypothetical protein